MRNKTLRIGIDASRALVNEPTGTERYSFELITRLVALPEAKEHEWILYVRPNLKFEIRNLKLNSNCKVQIINLPFLWTQLGLAYRTWVDRLDVLWVPAHTLPVLRNPRVKTVVTIHGIEYEWLPAYENRLQRWYLPLSTRYAVAAADKVIAVSRFTRNQLIDRLGADPGKIEVIYEGTSPSYPSPESGEGRKGEVLKKYGLHEKKYLLFIGTIQPRKNLERLIEAFRRLEVPEIKLVICGKWGWGYEKLSHLANDHLIFTGYVEDAIRQVLLKNALVYVQPSITEGFGLPVIEAIKNNIPAVISNGGALPELVPHPWPMFDPLNIEDIAAKLLAVIDDPKKRREMLIRGRKKANEFTWDRAARKTYSLLSLINDGNRG